MLMTIIYSYYYNEWLVQLIVTIYVTLLKIWHINTFGLYKTLESNKIKKKLVQEIRGKNINQKKPSRNIQSYYSEIKTQSGYKIHLSA